MKKLICLLAALALCLSMGIPAFAAENEFVPSIGYKDGPGIKDAEMGDEDVTDCLVISTIKQAEDKVTDITQDDRDLLLAVYDALKNGDMTLPIEGRYVIRDLLDVSYKYENCRQKEEHGNKPEKLKEEGVTLTVTFDLGIDAADSIIVLAFVEGEAAARTRMSTRQWVEAKNVTNNGDGTLTVEFEDICPVAFVTKLPDSAPTGDSARGPLGLFIGLMVLSGAAIVVLICLKGKKK